MKCEYGFKAKLQKAKKDSRLVKIFIHVRDEEEEVDGDFNEGQRDFLIRKINGHV